ncbi:MAG: hypothetical protein EPN33_01165 [Acidobacteria bacterium]|nr:MAG: hypothetical protein EPN33_01165 [Acidobacteriota bacterium]
MRFHVAACYVGIVLLMATGAASGQSRVRMVTISAVGNQVQAKLPPPAGTTSAVAAWARTSRNAPVIEGEGIRTEPNSFAEVELECGSALRLAPESDMMFTRLRLSQKSVPETTVKLNRGEVFFTMQDADVPDFHAVLPGGVIRMTKGGERLRLDVPSVGMNSVEVLGGQISIQAGGKSEQVKAKRRVEFVPGGGMHQVAMLKPDRWQKWSQRRDDAFHRQVIAQETTTRPRDLSALVPSATGPLTPGVLGSSPQTVVGPILGAMNDEASRVARMRRVPYCAHR